MWTVSEHQIRARVNYGLCKKRQISTRFAGKKFGAIWDVLLVCSFGAAVKRNDDNVGFFDGFGDKLPRKFQIVDVRHEIVMSKADKSDFLPF